MILLHKEEFDALGKGKASLTHPLGRLMRVEALAEWLDHEGGYVIFATPQEPFGDTEGILKDHPKRYLRRSFCWKNQDRPLAF